MTEIKKCLMKGYARKRISGILMKTIKLDFVDFWDGFDKKDNFFYKIIAERYKVIISDNPDYIFFSVFGVEHKKYNCIKIFYTGESVSPDFEECDYAMGFDYIEFGDRYCRLPNYLRKTNDVELVSKKHLNVEAAIKQKESFCCFCYSNGSAKERNYFFKELSKYKKVDSGGTVFNNIGYLVGNGRHTKAKDRDSSKIEWQKKYKFCIAFENISYNGYTTEKLPQAFAAQTIPIYWGNPLIGKEFNENAFINCHKYSNFLGVVEMIKKIDNDEALFKKMLSEQAWDDKLVNKWINNAQKFILFIFEQDIKESQRRCTNAFKKLNRKQKEILYSEKIICESIKNKTVSKGFELDILKAYLKRIKK